MAEYIKRKIFVDLVLSKLKFMDDARIMNQNDEKVLSEIDGYEKAINAVHELILDKDLIEDVQPVKRGMTELKPCPFCGSEAVNCTKQYDGRIYRYRIQCDNAGCACRTPWLCYQEDAVEVWNRRTKNDR